MLQPSCNSNAVLSAVPDLWKVIKYLSGNNTHSVRTF